MALVAADRSTAIATALSAQMTALYPASVPGIAAYHGAIATAVASAVVTYLQAHADVNPGTLAIGGVGVTGKGVLA